MKNNIILIFLVLILIVSCDRHEEKKLNRQKKTYKIDKLEPEGCENVTVVGEYINDKKDGEFVYYHPDKTLIKTETYKNDTLHGISKQYDDKNNLFGISYYNKGKFEWQICFREDKTIWVYNFFGGYRSYFCDGKISEITYYANNTEEKIIEFYINGKLKHYNFKQRKLTRRDSLEISRDYPDWLEQIRELEEKTKEVD